MKRLIALICALLTLSAAAFAAEAGAVYGGDLNDGTYRIEVESSSSMFRVVDCELTVKDGKMTALMTLSGVGYEKLFMGSGDEAAAADEFIYFKENPAGKYTYAVPVEALDMEIPCAAYSIRKQSWYDRTLVFKSASLPESARKNGISPGIASCVAVGAALAAAAAVLALRAKKRENERH